MVMRSTLTIRSSGTHTARSVANEPSTPRCRPRAAATRIASDVGSPAWEGTSDRAAVPRHDSTPFASLLADVGVEQVGQAIGEARTEVGPDGAQPAGAQVSHADGAPRSGRIRYW